jgi:glyoxylase-like metal-dependent hydrolase (beta-lactamase superfamily II)
VTIDVDVILAPNPSPMTGRGTNTYVLGRDEVAVIDPGPAIPGHLEQVAAAVSDRGTPTWVLLTHHHQDHAEAAEDFARRLGAPLAAIPHPSSPRLDRALTDHDRLEVGAGTLEVLATPGHSRDHACFAWSQARAVLVGDLVAGEGFIVIDPPEGDMSDYLASLGKVRDHRFGGDPAGPAVLLPAHGPAIENPRALLDSYIAHRLAREQQVLLALPPDGGATPAEVLPVAYADTPEGMYPVAARSLQAHLDKLVRDGLASEAGGRYTRLD